MGSLKLYTVDRHSPMSAPCSKSSLWPPSNCKENVGSWNTIFIMYS